MSKAEHKPNPDPHWVKETLVEDYLANARKHGSQVSSTDVERVVLGDLNLTEAVERETKQAPPVRRRPERQGPSGRVQRLAQELGVEVAKSAPGQPIRKRKRFGGFLHRRPANLKQAAAIKRLGEILQPRSWFKPSKEFDYTIPALAQSFAEMMMRLDRGLGEFEGKSEVDCERIVWRRIEDLCDKSTGVLGAWWVK